jgi:hypothetical protein
MGRWGDGEMGRWGDGEMGRWVRIITPQLTVNTHQSTLNTPMTNAHFYPKAHKLT